MKSSAVTGTPSDHTALGSIWYWMVRGVVEVTSTLWSRSPLSVGTRVGVMVKALGSTFSSRVGVDESAPAGVRGLNPLHGWSTSTLAVPPVVAVRSETIGSSTSLIRWAPTWSTVATMRITAMITRGRVHRARRSAQKVANRPRRPSSAPSGLTSGAAGG